MVDGFRYGRTGQWSEDQVPDCVDHFTKECLTITAAFGISGAQVMRILDSIALFRAVRRQ